LRRDAPMLGPRFAPVPGLRFAPALGLHLAPALGLLAALGCDAPRAASCPGDRVGTFHFQGALEDGGCPFPTPAVSFVATLAYGAAGQAVLCVDRAEAAPLAGTRVGDRVSLASPSQSATVPTCPCPVQVTERVDGEVLRTGAGAAAGFAGVLESAVAPGDGGTGAGCEPDGGAIDGGLTCGVPCTLSWRLSAGP
jgi:hypothetical protein